MKNTDFKFDNPVIEEVYLLKNLNFDNTPNPSMSINLGTHINNETDNTATVTLQLVIGNESLNDPSCPFYLKTKTSAHFSWGSPKIPAEQLLKVNAPALLLSYTRPIISLLTSQAGLKPIHIPFIDFTKPSNDDEDSSN